MGGGKHETNGTNSEQDWIYGCRDLVPRADLIEEFIDPSPSSGCHPGLLSDERRKKLPLV